MRKVSRTNIMKPVELGSSECLAHLGIVIAAPAKAIISADLYKGKRVNQDGTIEFAVQKSLKELYKNKCAYCEKMTHNPRIDHHRPKGRVVGGGNQNRGYYWLCYEWTNLLPSCTDCNSIEAKGARYPLAGIRNNTHPQQGDPPVIHSPSFIYDSPFNTSELPLLIHPEYSNPENEFNFNKLGVMIGRTEAGINTVEVLKLDNYDLNGWRKKIYDDHLAHLKKIVRKYFRQVNPISANIFKELIMDWVEKIVQQANDENLDFTLFRKYLLKNIDYFFISELDPVFQIETRNNISEALVTLSE